MWPIWAASISCKYDGIWRFCNLNILTDFFFLLIYANPRSSYTTTTWPWKLIQIFECWWHKPGYLRNTMDEWIWASGIGDELHVWMLQVFIFFFSFKPFPMPSIMRKQDGVKAWVNCTKLSTVNASVECTFSSCRIIQHF